MSNTLLKGQSEYAEITVLCEIITKNANVRLKIKGRTKNFSIFR